MGAKEMAPNLSNPSIRLRNRGTREVTQAAAIRTGGHSARSISGLFKHNSHRG